MKKHQKNHFGNIALFTRFNLAIAHSLEHDGASSGQGHHRPGYNAQEEEELQNLTDTVVTATASEGESRDTRSSLHQQKRRIYPEK